MGVGSLVAVSPLEREVICEEASALGEGGAGRVGGGEDATRKWSHISWMTGWRDHPAEPAAQCLPKTQLAVIPTPSIHRTQGQG